MARDKVPFTATKTVRASGKLHHGKIEINFQDDGKGQRYDIFVGKVCKEPNSATKFSKNTAKLLPFQTKRAAKRAANKIAGVIRKMSRQDVPAYIAQLIG